MAIQSLPIYNFVSSCDDTMVVVVTMIRSVGGIMRQAALFLFYFFFNFFLNFFLNFFSISFLMMIRGVGGMTRQAAHYRRRRQRNLRVNLRRAQGDLYIYLFF